MAKQAQTWRDDQQKRYRQFRERFDPQYLFAISEWQRSNAGEVDEAIEELRRRLEGAHQAGSPLRGVVQLADFVSIPTEAWTPQIEGFSRTYWQFECLAFDYQAACREEIYPGAIYVRDSTSPSLRMTAPGTPVYRTDPVDKQSSVCNFPELCSKCHREFPLLADYRMRASAD
jgi:hypothetical protein